MATDATSATGDERPVAPLVWTGAPLPLPAADDPRAREQSKFDFADLFSEFIIGT